jgi:hypothetical protein
MATFAGEQARDAIKPRHTFKLPPSAFKDGPDKPAEARDVGIRLLSEGDLQSIRAHAARKTAESMKGISTTADVWIAAFNNELMIGAVCEALCHPEDTGRPYWPIQQTAVRTYLAPGGIERIWDELEALKVREAPTAPEATADDLAALCARLAVPTFAGNLMAGDARALRRMLRHCLDMLEASDPPVTETPPADTGFWG